MRQSFSLLLLFLFLGCASLSQDQCRKGDWQKLGHDDGRLGKRSTQVDDHIKACASYGISLDEKLYNQGRIKGLSEYCTKENGYTTGIKGLTYNNVCRGNSEVKFLEMYRLGQKTHLINQELKENQRDLQVSRQNLSNPSTNNGDKEDLKREIKRLEEEEELLKRKLIFLKSKAPYRPEDIVDLF